MELLHCLIREVECRYLCSSPHWRAIFKTTNCVVAISLLVSFSLSGQTHTHRLHVNGLGQSYIVRSLIHILAECLPSVSSADVGMLLWT